MSSRPDRLRWGVLLVPVVLTISLAACSSVTTVDKQGRTVRSWKSWAPDYADSTAATSDPWVQQAGAEARGLSDRQSDYEEDPLGIRPLFVSEKARSIERNLGVH